MPIFTTIIALCWTALVVYWIVSSFGIKRDVRRRSWWRALVRGGLVRIAILAIVILVLRSSLVDRSALKWSFTISNPWLAAVGAAIAVIGAALAIWARRHLGRNWSPVPNLKEGHELVTSGPYRLIRHPIYTGIILAALGSGLVIVWWLIAFVVMIGTFAWRVGVEEKLMTQQFPNEYPEYKKRTWALVPYVW